MKLSEKIILLRKKEGFSQEDLSEKLNVSRQAVSRWETGSALPDAQNILQISKIFAVTTDYLLNDDYDEIIPKTCSKTKNKQPLRIIGIIMMVVGVLGNSIIYILSRFIKAEIYRSYVIEGVRRYRNAGKGYDYVFFIKEHKLEELVIALVLMCIVGLILACVKKEQWKKLKDYLVLRIKNNPLIAKYTEKLKERR